MNTNELLSKLMEEYNIKFGDANELNNKFRDNFNKQRREVNKDMLDSKELNEILYAIVYLSKDVKEYEEEKDSFKRFKKDIERFGKEETRRVWPDKKEKCTGDPYYLAEKYENYKKLTEKFNVALYKATDTYLKFRAMFNMQRALKGKKELTYKEMDTFIEIILPSYSSIDEFVRDTDDLKEGGGELMKLVCGNPLEDLVV